MIESNETRKRCPWCLVNEKMTRYHDLEWGVPTRDDRVQFQHLMMEVMQCGLNWNMILQRREILRDCFADFNFDLVAEFCDTDVQRIMDTPGMIRSPRKIRAIIHNARCFQAIRREFGSFSAYIWNFVDNKSIVYAGHPQGRRVAFNGLSKRVSADLKKRGFKYLGPTTVYSHLQSCGVINDHLETCSRYAELRGAFPTIDLSPNDEPEDPATNITTEKSKREDVSEHGQ